MTSTEEENDHNDDDDDVKIVGVRSSSSFHAPAAMQKARARWKDFCHQNHSLQINASSVAACVGYHEFQSLPELMLKHVYQGGRGRELLEHDAQLLGLTLPSEEDHEALLVQLAEATGSAKVVETTKRALQIKRGDLHEQGSLRSVEDARALKETVVSELKKQQRQQQEQQLPSHQAQILQEGIRQAIDTGYGNYWEDQALDRYQEECGWEVRERNAECRVWDFEKTQGEEETEEDGIHSSNNNNKDKVPSIRPMGPARARRRRKDIGSGISGNDASSHCNKNRFDSRGVKRKLPSSHDSQISETALMELSIPAIGDSNTTSVINSNSNDNDDDKVAMEGSSADGAEDIAGDVISIDDDSVHDDELSERNRIRQGYSRTMPLQIPNRRKPFVSIKGMVDGIRDELGPTTKTGETKDNHHDNGDGNAQDEDEKDDLSCGSFALSRVVVECKHRMKALLPNGPRFSECIQAVVYCFMYETDEADIVQVVRSKLPRRNVPPKLTQEADCKDSGRLLTNYFQPKSSSANPNDGLPDGGHDEDDKNVEGHKNTNNATEPCSHSTTKDGDVSETTTTILAEARTETIKDNPTKDELDSDITLQIAVDRVSLDDPNFGHRANWKAVILPKLRRWVDAVYAIRQSDDKRYRLLTAVVGMTAAASAYEDATAAAQSPETFKDHARVAWELVLEECDFLREGRSGERYRIETQ